MLPGQALVESAIMPPAAPSTPDTITPPSSPPWTAQEVRLRASFSAEQQAQALALAKRIGSAGSGAGTVLDRPTQQCASS